MHDRMLPSKPKACPLWTTKSLKYGFSPVDVQRSLTVHPPDPCASAMRRMPAPPAMPSVLIRILPSLLSARWTIVVPPPVHGYDHRSAPVEGATAAAPDPLSSRT